MSTRDRGRQQSLRSRLLGWAGTTAPPRGPSQRQPSRVTTTLAQPQSPASAEGQPSSQPQPRPQPPSGAPSRRSPSLSQPPPSSSAKPPQMGAAPSRPASDTRPPWTSPGPTQTTARATPVPSPLSDGASPRSQPGEGAPQPVRRIPSRQWSRTYSQPPSPPGPPSQTQAAGPPVPSPSPPPPPASPAPPAITTEPKAPSPTPSPALPPPPAASRSPSPPPAKPPSPQIRPPSPKEIPEVPPPAPRVLHLEAASTKQEGKEEETTTSPAAKLQPQEASPEEDQTAIDPASMRIEAAGQPPAAEAGDKHISTVTHTVQHPSPEETQRDTTRGQLPPTEDEIDQKQTKDSSKPPKPEPEEKEEEKKTEPEAKEEEKLVIGPEAGQKSDPRLLHETEREVDGTEGEKRSVNQAELDQESDPNRPKNIYINPDEVKEETPNTSPLPTPAENLQIKDQKETPTSNTPETKLAPLEQTQIKDGQETAEGVEKTKQATQEPQQQPTQVHLQPIREVHPSDAQPARGKQPSLPEKEPAPPTSTTKGKEGKIAISTVARASASSGGEQSGGLHKEIKEGISRLVQSLAVQHSKQTGAGQGISIITLAGDNQGATMYVGQGTPSRDGNQNVFVHKGPSANGGGDAVAPGEDSGQKKTVQQLMPTTDTNANVNSNVQAVNNSILHDSCCSEENPGVHLVLSAKPPELAPQNETAKPAQLQRPRTRAPLLQKMAQEPTVRRRCLRAMFLESSEDDPENPRKPRRHGCRFNCEDTKSAKG